MDLVLLTITGRAPVVVVQTVEVASPAPNFRTKHRVPKSWGCGGFIFGISLRTGRDIVSRDANGNFHQGTDDTCGTGSESRKVNPSLASTLAVTCRRLGY